MYKNLRPRNIDIVVEVKHYENTCGGCPTIYDFKDTEGTQYYFRLRNGGARIVCEDTDEVLTSGDMRGFDGVCGWDDVVEWAMKQGVLLEENY